MQRAAVFFDRDNTLIRNDGYLADPDQVVLIEARPTQSRDCVNLALRSSPSATRAAWCGGMFTEDAVRAVNTRMDEMLRKQNPARSSMRMSLCP